MMAMTPTSRSVAVATQSKCHHIFRRDEAGPAVRTSTHASTWESVFHVSGECFAKQLCGLGDDWTLGSHDTVAEVALCLILS